jgi:hypothetical protein
MSAIEDVETHGVSAFLSLVVKLNENLFKPIFLETFDWATSSQNVARSICFYRIVEALADKLKVLLYKCRPPYLPNLVNLHSLLRLHFGQFN